MEQEKKKRVRPTLTQMRQLQKELADVKDSYRKQLTADNDMAEQINELKRKNKTLEASNFLLKEEIERLNRRNGNLLDTLGRKSEKLLLLKTRKFWARVFNMGIDD